MTCETQAVDDIEVLGSKPGMGDGNGVYERLRGSADPDLAPCCTRKRDSLRWWAKVVFLCLCLATATAAFIFFCGPLIIKKRWLDKWPKKAAIVRLAGEGDWFHQFRAVTLLRISPFPYIIFNYAAVATNVRYGPYISGSLVGTVPEVFITIYSGRLLRSLAEATNRGSFLSVQQILYDVLGFCIAVAATTAITIYAKRTLQTLQAEDELC